jgi:hypothetical protein
MDAPWVGKEERQKESKMVEEMRQKRREAEEQAKHMERAAKSNLSFTLSSKAGGIVQEIITLEDLIADREIGQPDPSWRVSLKEQEMLDELEALEDEYSGQKRRMREACDKHIDDIIRKRDEELEKIEQKLQDEITRANYKKEEISNKHKETVEMYKSRLEIAMKNKEEEENKNIDRKKKKIGYLSDKKDCLVENQKIPVSLKKMKRQLAELIQRFPTVKTEWITQGYKAEELSDIPNDYKQHKVYKMKRGITEENQIEIPKPKSESSKPEVALKIKNDTPLLEKSENKKGGSENNFSVQAEPTTSVKPLSSPPIVRKRKTVAIAENASGSMFNGINIISSAKRPEVTFTVIVPGKKWIDYSSEERSNMSHYDAYTLEFEWKAELAAEKERKDREWKAKLSREEDEAEADAIRDMRKAEEAEKEWEELED